MGEGYKPPVVSVGDPVEFFMGHDAKPRAAFVMEVSGRVLTVKAMTGGGFVTRRECIHREDPELTDNRVSIDRRVELSNCMWDLPERQKVIENRLNTLEAELRRLQGAVDGGPEVNEVVRAGDLPEISDSPQEAEARRLARDGKCKKEICKATKVHHKSVERIMREVEEEAA